MTKTTEPVDKPLSLARLTIFGFPALPHAFVAGALYSILPAYYAANTTVSLAAIGAIAGASRIFDALNDPIVGYLSDRTKTRLGARKPWLLGAIFFCVLSITQLFQPPADATIIYFAWWSTVLYTGFTMFEIPRSAWSAELSRDYHERTRIMTYVALFNIAGSLSFYAVPIVTSILTGSTTQITGETLGLISWIYMVVMPIGLIAAIIFVPSGRQVTSQPATMKGVFASLWRSKPLLRYCTIVTAWGLGQGALIGTVFIFQTDYMGLGDYFVFIMITLFASSILALPVWNRVLKTMDRHRLWALCVALPALAAPLILFFEPGPSAFIPALIFAAFKGFMSSPANFVPTAVLSDVIDYDTMKTGTNKAANFFAFKNILEKIAMAIGGAIAFGIMDAMGYQIGKTNDDTANMGLLIAYMAMPIAFHLLTAALAWHFPISAAKHKIIQRRLESRRAPVEPEPELDVTIDAQPIPAA
ncbi:Melibiose carrier protein [Alphaproteobacteria bacterium SO-S41]|nr:Melibiose carrier protein [Alphaproteobacteria bacterium SO-S41]